MKEKVVWKRHVHWPGSPWAGPDIENRHSQMGQAKKLMDWHQVLHSSLRVTRGN